MQIEIWSDLVCPWCTIGKRRFEKALEKFEHREEVTVQLRSFELDPNTQKDFDGTLNQWLAQRKGISLQQAEAMNDQVAELAAKEDLVFRLNQAKPANTLDAHRLTLLAESEGKRVAMTERLYRAYFGDGEDLNDLATLARLAGEAGLTFSEIAVT
jgi:predicted DsbA family dithiol-disulfide isomerase